MDVAVSATDHFFSPATANMTHCVDDPSVDFWSIRDESINGNKRRVLKS